MKYEWLIPVVVFSVIRAIRGSLPDRWVPFFAGSLGLVLYSGYAYALNRAGVSMVLDVDQGIMLGLMATAGYETLARMHPMVDKLIGRDEP